MACLSPGAASLCLRAHTNALEPVPRKGMLHRTDCGITQVAAKNITKTFRYQKRTPSSAHPNVSSTQIFSQKWPMPPNIDLSLPRTVNPSTICVTCRLGRLRERGPGREGPGGRNRVWHRVVWSQAHWRWGSDGADGHRCQLDGDCSST